MKSSLSVGQDLPVGKYILFPDTILKYPCEMCGKCCNSTWVVQLEGDEFFRYRRILEESDLPSDYLSYIQEVKKDDRTSYKLLPRNGRCIFLQDDNKCYIHFKQGPKAKSQTCNYFPLSASAFSPRGMHLKISFKCASTLKSLLKDDIAHISSSNWDNNLSCHPVLPFSADNSISWQNAFRLTDSLISFFHQSTLTIEKKLLAASLWVSGLNSSLKGSRLDEFQARTETEYLLNNTDQLMDKAAGFDAVHGEQVKLLNHIVQVMLEGNIEFARNSSVSHLMKLLNPDSIVCIDSMRMSYHRQYVPELQAFTGIIERYCTQKIVSYELFIKKGVLFGINKLVLCYCLLRAYLLAKIIFEKELLKDDDILESISFVEMIIFHNRSAQYLDSPHIMKILSNPYLSMLLLRI